MPPGELRVALRVRTVLAVIPRNVSSGIKRGYVPNATKVVNLTSLTELVQPAVEPNREEDVAVAVPSVPRPGTSPGLMRIPGLPLGMGPTRHCPSCESGMNAPSAAAEQSAPEVAQEDVAMDFEATDHRLPMDISMIDVCQCSEQIRIGCLTSPDLLFQERLSVES
eukprot:s3181_g11.t1